MHICLCKSACVCVCVCARTNMERGCALTAAALLFTHSLCKTGAWAPWHQCRTTRVHTMPGGEQRMAAQTAPIPACTASPSSPGTAVLCLHACCAPTHTGAPMRPPLHVPQPRGDIACCDEACLGVHVAPPQCTATVTLSGTATGKRDPRAHTHRTRRSIGSGRCESDGAQKHWAAVCGPMRSVRSLDGTATSAL